MLSKSDFLEEIKSSTYTFMLAEGKPDETAIIAEFGEAIGVHCFSSAKIIFFHDDEKAWSEYQEIMKNVT